MELIPQFLNLNEVRQYLSFNLYHSSDMQFSTKDQDNDIGSSHCAQLYKGAWWYDQCHRSNLNGLYLNGRQTTYANGVNWYAFRGYNYSLRRTEMKVKTKG